MATVIAPPTIVNTQRINASIFVQYQAGATGYVRVYYDLKTDTSGWSQATSETTLNGQYTITSWGGTPLDVNAKYYVRMRALHTSGAVTEPSNEVAVDPITVAPPTITQAVRAQGSYIAVNYTAGASGYIAMYYQLRTTTRPWSQATSETQRNGQYTITSWAGQALDPKQTYWVRMNASHTSGRTVPFSNEVQVGPWVTPQPAIVSVARIGEKSARINYEDGVAGHLRPRIRALPDGQWTTLTAQAISAAAGQITIPLPDGAIQYAVDIANVQFGGVSKPSSSTTVEAWWQKPPAATIGAVTRDLDGAITVPFTGSPTARAPWTSIVARWLVAGSTSWQSRTLSGSARTVRIVADAVRAVTVEIEPHNAAGPATSAASTTVAASMLPPESLAVPTVTWAADGKATVSWTLPTTTPDKQVQAVRVERVTTSAAGQVSVATVATVAAPGTSTVDTPPLNVLVEYQLVAENAAGSSPATSPKSSQAATLPLGASLLTAARSGADIAATWTVPDATTAASWALEFTTSALGKAAPEVDWFPLTSPTGSARTATHASVAEATHTYRIRPVHPLLPAVIVPAWLFSRTLSADAPPLAPTLGSPMPLDPREPIKLPFTHRPVDGSVQTAATVRWRLYGETSWLDVVSLTTETFATMPADLYGEGFTFEWQASTTGKHPSPSPFASGVFTTRYRPEVAIVPPSHGATISGGVLEVEADVTTFVTEIRATLLDASGTEVDQRTVPLSGYRQRFDVADGVYTIRLEGWDGYQWSLPVSATVTVELASPPRPLLAAKVVGESIELSASAIEGLSITRVSWPAWFDMPYWHTVEGSFIDRQTLLAADGSRTPAIRAQDSYPPARISSPPVQADLDWPQAWPSAYVSARVEVSTLGGQASGTAQGLGWVSDVAQGSFGITSAAPVWPASTVGICEFGPQATGLGKEFRIEVETVGDVVTHSPMLFAARTPEDAARLDPFDGDTVDPAYGSAVPGEITLGEAVPGSDGIGYLYGWMPGHVGVAYEAVYAEDGVGDLPVEPVVRIAYFQSKDGGKSWTVIGDGTGEGWALSYDDAPLNRKLLVKARAYAEGGGWTDSLPVELVIDSSYIVLSWSENGVARSVRAIHDPNLSHTRKARHTVTKRYAGDDLDTLYFGPEQGRSISVSCVLLDDEDLPPSEWLDVANLGHVVTYRDPSGVVMSGALTGDVGWQGTHSAIQSLSFGLVEGVAG